MKITVLLGGTSSERDVSLASGLRVATALRSFAGIVELGAFNCKTCPRLSRPFAMFECDAAGRDQKGSVSAGFAGPARSGLVRRPIAAKARENSGDSGVLALANAGMGMGK